jgi:hypothetical protein
MLFNTHMHTSAAGIAQFLAHLKLLFPSFSCFEGCLMGVGGLHKHNITALLRLCMPARRQLHRV